MTRRPASRSGLRLALVALGLAALVAGCSSGGSDAGGTTERTTTTAPATTSTTTKRADQDSPGTLFAKGWPKGSGGSCDGHEPGRRGVVMTFCRGTAAVVVTVAGAAHSLPGVCWVNAGRLEVDAGVQVGRGFAGAWPDAVTFQVSPSAGPAGGVLAAWIAGERHVVQDAKGSVDVARSEPGITIDDGVIALHAVHIDLEGFDLISRQTISVSVDCTTEGGPAGA